MGGSFSYAASQATKVTSIREWFDWEFSKSESRRKATLLLLYPEAFGFWQFLPSTIGWPKHIWDCQTPSLQLTKGIPRETDTIIDG